MTHTRKPLWLSLTALSLAVSAQVAHADERESLEALRQTTIGLIDALVDKGVLTRDAADAMLKQARARAEAAQAVAPTAKSETTASGKPVQRVPYVSEAMKAQIRNEVKEEVLTQARAERWGVPNAAPAWTDRIKIDGDIRYRHQGDRPSSDNTPASDYVSAVLSSGGIIRSPEFATSDGGPITARASTTETRERERLRLRVGLTAKVSDEVGVGVRLATGNTDDRVSTNQTLGNNFNKSALLVDRAFIKVDPADWVSINAGRMPNPWFSTDMVWSENLNFDGLAATARYAQPDAPAEPFATVGVFPLRDKQSPLRTARWLYGAQVGSAWQIDSRTRLKGGLAYYSYQNLAGRQAVSGTDYIDNNGTLTLLPGFGQYGYATGNLGQKGNTLFEVTADANQASITGGGSGVAAQFGLAYDFRPVVLTLSAELTHFSPYSLLLSAEYARNTAFSVSGFQRRAGSLYSGVNPGGRADGYLMRLGFGSAEVREAGQWLATLTYKHVGSDAVLDAFTDSDMGLGGTNLRGYSLAFTYGLYRNTNIGLRFLSSKSIDSPINDITNPSAKFGVNSLQVDFNVRF